MNGQTITAKLLKGVARARRQAAAVIAALLFLVGTTAGAQALTKAGTGTPILGLTPGQTMRVTVFNPGGPGRGGESATTAHVKVFDGRGGLLHQTPEADVPPGGFHSFDIDRAGIPAAGEPRTGRLQVRVEIVISAPAEGGANGNTYTGGTVIIEGALELINNDTGETAVALLLPAIQAAREAARR